MMDFLEGHVSNRKTLLFGCACWRRVWHLFGDEKSRMAVVVMERYADGLATQQELTEAAKAAMQVQTSGPPADVSQTVGMSLFAPQTHAAAGVAELAGLSAERLDLPAICASALVASQVANRAAWMAAGEVYGGKGVAGPALFVALTALAKAGAAAEWAEEEAQCGLLRDIFGPHPDQPLKIDPSWLTPTVISLATAAYEGRHMPSGLLENSRFAVLADGLEEAGCDEAGLLGHLRGPGVHCRGCWAVDVVLGRR